MSKEVSGAGLVNFQEKTNMRVGDKGDEVLVVRGSCSISNPLIAAYKSRRGEPVVLIRYHLTHRAATIINV